MSTREIPTQVKRPIDPTDTRSHGGHSMVAPLKRVLMKRPDDAFGSADPERWHYTDPIDLTEAQREHDALADRIRAAGAEVVGHDEPQEGRADAIYVFDPVWITDHGAIVLSMGKTLRRGEEEALERRLEALGIPTLFRLEGEARAEGGDMFWLDDRTLAVGHGFRTNQAGIDQLRRGLEPHGIDVVDYDLPYHTGPAACLHLLSMLSLLDDDLAVVYPPLMPVPLVLELERRGIEQVAVPDEEFPTQGPNVLALAPRHALALEGNPITRRRLEAAGCRVETYRGREISWKAEGGPTCLTRPLLRDVA